MKNKTPSSASISINKPPAGFFRSRAAALFAAVLFTTTAFELSPATFAQEKKSPQKEFQSLSESRKERKQLIDFLIKKGQAKEIANGTLTAQANADAEAKKAIAAENKTRLRMFQLIAATEKKSPDAVGREFHKKLPKIVVAAPKAAPAATKKLLTLRGSSSIGSELAPVLTAAFLKQKGYKNVKITHEKMSDRVKITGIHPKNRNETALIEIHSTNSAGAFDKHGLLGKRCDIGMSSRQALPLEAEKMVLENLGDPRDPKCEIPFAMDALTVVVHPDNPTNSLSVRDVARLYAGYNREWSSVNGGNCDFGVIDLYAREDTSGQWINFQKLIMQPYKKVFATEFSQRFIENADIVENVLSNPNGLGIISISDINPKLKVLKIKSDDRGPARLPTSSDMQGGNYALAHPVYFYLPATPTPIAHEFINFSISVAGQDIVDDSRMVAIVPPTDRNYAKTATAKPMVVAVPVKKIVKTPSATPLPESKKVVAKPEAAPVSQLPITSEETKAAYQILIKNADRKDSPTDLQFASSYGSTLKANSRKQFDSVVGALKKPENADAKIVIIGFSDSRGTLRNNQRLSEERAAGVARLFKRVGIKNVVHSGFGEAMPATSNMLADGRDRNRRVEIWLQR